MDQGNVMGTGNSKIDNPELIERPVGCASPEVTGRIRVLYVYVNIQR
jgi:hypothetical protein